jgi:hypothetical protein
MSIRIPSLETNLSQFNPAHIITTYILVLRLTSHLLLPLKRILHQSSVRDSFLFYPLYLYVRFIKFELSECKQNLCYLKQNVWREALEKIHKGFACYLLHAGFLFGLFFDPEDGGDMFLRNVVRFSTNYAASTPRRYSSSRISLFF